MRPPVVPLVGRPQAKPGRGRASVSARRPPRRWKTDRPFRESVSGVGPRAGRSGRGGSLAAEGIGNRRPPRRVWSGMTATQTDAPPGRKPLRLWPGVLAVALQWLAWLVLP